MKTGPGHNDVIQDDSGTEWLVYQAYERSNPWVGPIPRRVLMLDPVRWEDDWPTLNTSTPSRTIPRPVIDEP